MRVLVPLLLVAFAAACTDGQRSVAEPTTVLMVCFSESSRPETELCVDGAPNCAAWRRTVDFGREVWRRARDEHALESERLCREYAARVAALDLEPRRGWSRGSAEEVSRSLARRN